MIHPAFCYLGVTLAFGLSLTLFVQGWLDVRTYFYAPLVLLIGFYTAHSVLTDRIRTSRVPGDRSCPRPSARP